MDNPIHGHFDVRVEGQILHCQCTGLWNEEAATAYADAFLAAAKQICDQPWAHCVDIRHWHAGVPEIFPHIRRVVEWSFENNIQAAVVITSGGFVKIKQIEKLLSYKGRSLFMIAETPDEAKELFQSRGFDFQSAV